MQGIIATTNEIQKDVLLAIAYFSLKKKTFKPIYIVRQLNMMNKNIDYLTFNHAIQTLLALGAIEKSSKLEERYKLVISPSIVIKYLEK